MSGYDIADRRERNEFSSHISFFNNIYEGKPHKIVKEEAATAIDLADIDLQLRRNGSSHQTSMYHLMKEEKAMVLRRGSPFSIVLTFLHDSYSNKQDNLKLVFHTGDNPSVPKGTYGIAVLNERADKHTRNDHWEAVIKEKRDKMMTISVMIPVDAPIGMWEGSIETSYEAERWSTKKQLIDLPMYILFNPFISTDPTYMPNQAERNEYLMEETGKIYGGTYKAMKGRPWVFGQFEPTILAAACHVLASANIKPGERGNPILVARALSAMVNYNDKDNGVLVGKWDGDYEDGVDPHRWSGSVRILEDYMRNGGRSIRYGQCWVFSGMLTTVCRALGLPCRPVTCYKSAHDTNKSLTVDKYYSPDGEELHGIAGVPGIMDTIWNFHCWNDVWMARHDLPAGYGGWQAIDSTPQERSDGLMQVGPSSVEAVRRGDVGLGFDTAFVFTEVNADVLVFVQDERSSWGFRKIEQNERDRSHVGKMVVTKAVGKFGEEETDRDWEDITHLYKCKEGTRDERRSVMKALKCSGSPAINFYDMPSSSTQDVEVKILDLERCLFGKPYKVGVFLHNKSRQDRTLKVVLSSSSVFYTGVRAHLVKRGSGEFRLRGNEQESFSMEIFPEDYLGRTVDMCFMKNLVFVTVKETDQTWSTEDDFILEKPNLYIRTKDWLRSNEVFDVEAFFTNPLDIPLTKCTFNIEAAGILKSQDVSFRDVGPGEQVRAVIALKARSMGKATLMVVFNSLELSDLTGTKKIIIS